MKKKTKEMQKEEVVEVVQPQIITEQDNAQRIDVLKTFFNRLDKFEETLNQRQLIRK